MAPEDYSIGVTKVYGAKVEENGDVTVCVDLVNPNDLTLQQFVGISLPVARFKKNEDPAIEKWMSSGAPSSNSSLAIPVKPEGDKCVDQSWGTAVINASHLDPGSNGMAWRQYRKLLEEQPEFLVVDTTSVQKFEFSNLQGRTFGYFNSEIKRNLSEVDRIELDLNGKLRLVKLSRTERELEFYFPTKSTGVRWGNIWMFFLVFGDIFLAH